MVCVDKSLLFIEINGPDVTDFDSVKYCITRFKADTTRHLIRKLENHAKKILLDRKSVV